MALKDLEGRRTGRPRGAKTTPRWVRDARWVNDNLDNVNAKAPTPLAARLLALGRKRPDKFASCLATLEAKAARQTRRGREARYAGLRNAGRAPKCIRALFIDTSYLMSKLQHDGIDRISNLPDDSYIV